MNNQEIINNEEKMKNSEKIEVLLVTFGHGQMGYDIRIKDDTATIADYLAALDYFAQQYMTDCQGCDGCCHERAPLTILDIEPLASLLQQSQYSAHQVITAFAYIEVFADGAIDISLKRNHQYGCYFLDSKNKICTQHQARPFVCRSHFCLAKSEQAQALRSIIANKGMDALIHLLWQEQQAGADKILPLLDPSDYENDYLRDKRSYDQVILKDILPADFWRQIYKDTI